MDLRQDRSAGNESKLYVNRAAAGEAFRKSESHKTTMKRLSLSFLAVAIPLAAQNRPAQQQNPEGPAAVDLPEAQIAGTIAGERFSKPEKQGDWPAIAAAADGSVYVLWIEWNDNDADQVLVRRRDSKGRWGPEIPIPDGNWDHYSPTIVAMPGGAAMAVWAAQSGGNYDLFSATVTAASKVSKPQRLTTAPFSDFNAPAPSPAARHVTPGWYNLR